MIEDILFEKWAATADEYDTTLKVETAPLGFSSLFTPDKLYIDTFIHDVKKTREKVLGVGIIFGGIHEAADCYFDTVLK
jgi:hypothetical protein